MGNETRCLGAEQRGKMGIEGVLVTRTLTYTQTLDGKGQSQQSEGREEADEDGRERLGKEPKIALLS